MAHALTVSQSVPTSTNEQSQFKMIKAFFVHGFNVKDNGAGSMGKLLPYYADAGMATEMVSYGHFNLFEPRWENGAVAEDLNSRIGNAKSDGYKTIVVGHSNGCAITQIAALLGAPIDKCVFISAALDSNTEFPPNVGAVDVWHSRKDWVLRLAKLLPRHKWGDMGRIGATRYDRRVKNFDRSQNYESPSAWHSDIFKSPLLEYFAPVIMTESLLRLPK